MSRFSSPISHLIKGAGSLTIIVKDAEVDLSFIPRRRSGIARHFTKAGIYIRKTYEQEKSANQSARKEANAVRS